MTTVAIGFKDPEESLGVALERFEQLLSENPDDGWKVVDSKTPEIKLWEKTYDVPRDPPPKTSTPTLRVARSETLMKANSADAVIEVVSSIDLQKQWDVSTIAANAALVENAGEYQIAYLPMKTLSASTSKRDLCVARMIKDEGNAKIFISTSCIHPKVPAVNDMVRAVQIVSAFKAEMVEPEVCKVTFVNCLDYTGWIHDKFVDADILKCATRLTKIRPFVLNRK